MTLDDLLDQEVAHRRVQAALLAGLAALAVALGANAANVFRTVARQGMALAAIGIAGTAGALALSRILASLLFGVQATDPVNYAGAVAVFVTVALLACYFPARRAARVDPMLALRHE